VPLDDLPGSNSEGHSRNKFRHNLFDFAVVEDGAVSFIAQEAVTDAPVVRSDEVGRDMHQFRLDPGSFPSN